MATYLVSPTEPPRLLELLCGFVGPLPESVGADIVTATTHGLLGVQRKTVEDLLSSIADGRLGRELALLRDNVRFRVLLVEGIMSFDSEECLVVNGWKTGYTRYQLQQLFRSCRYLYGVDKEDSYDIDDSVKVIEGLVTWLEKPVHVSLLNRPKPQGEWGLKPSRDELLTWFYQGLPGVGPRTAQKLAEVFPVPRQLVLASMAELQSIDGIGPVVSKRIVDFVEGGHVYNS